MKTSILQKCLDELNKATCRKDYVIGMLESLIETQDCPVFPAVQTMPYIPQSTFPGMPSPTYALSNNSGSGLVDLIPPSDETTDLANVYTRGPLGKVS